MEVTKKCEVECPVHTTWMAEPFSKWDGTSSRQMNCWKVVVWIGNCDVI